MEARQRACFDNHNAGCPQTIYHRPPPVPDEQVPSRVMCGERERQTRTGPTRAVAAPPASRDPWTPAMHGPLGRPSIAGTFIAELPAKPNSPTSKPNSNTASPFNHHSIPTNSSTHPRNISEETHTQRRPCTLRRFHEKAILRPCLPDDLLLHVTISNQASADHASFREHQIPKRQPYPLRTRSPIPRLIISTRPLRPNHPSTAHSVLVAHQTHGTLRSHTTVTAEQPRHSSHHSFREAHTLSPSSDVLCHDDGRACR